jgi:hypothetical protein
MLPDKHNFAVIASADIHHAEPVAFIPLKLITTCEGTMEVDANRWLQWNPNT